MDAPCPKCGYVRQPVESVAAHTCQRCGVVYAKYEAAQVERAAREAAMQQQAVAREQSARRRQAAVERGGAVARSGVAFAWQAITSNRWARLTAIAIVVLAIAALGNSTRPPAQHMAERPVAVVPRPAAPPAAQPMTPEEQVDAAVLRQWQAEKRQIDAEEAARKAQHDKFASAAIGLCAARVRSGAAFPSTVDISLLFGTSASREGAATRVVMDFTARNAMGVDLPYRAKCVVSDAGSVRAFDVQGR